MLPSISPQDAAVRINAGAMLIDIREPDEYARARIEGATNLPLSKLEEAQLAIAEGRVVLFHCRSGARTQGNATRLSAIAGECEAFIVQGGLDAWQRAGLPVQQDRRQPLELMRQVQIVAGSMAALGALLGATVSPWFYWLSAGVGAGLMFAGITGTCALATILRQMPWNRALAA